MSQFSKVVDDADEAMSIKFNTMVYDLRRQGKKVTVLSLGEAFFDIPLMPMDVLPVPEIYHYSHSLGLPELREKLAGYFMSEYGVPFDPEKEILISAGSKAAVHMTFMSILDPGDEVIIPEPYWVSYPEQVKLCYGKPVPVPHQKSVFEYGDYVTDRTKAIVICNPHNPRGYVHTPEELQYLIELGRERGIWILSDEAYSDFLLDGSFTSLGKLDPQKTCSVVFNSISKNYGISGWRLGYVIAKNELIQNVLKVQQHLITCPATILEYYLVRYFDDILKITKPQILAVVDKRKHLAGFMDSIGIEHLPGTATFYFFASIEPSKLSSVEFCTRLLEEEHICVVPGVGYGESCDGYVRISIGTAELDEIEDALRRFKRLIDATS
jgi:aspartate aminotransferase/aminotransferase